MKSKLQTAQEEYATQLNHILTRLSHGKGSVDEIIGLKRKYQALGLK
jgi:hypothetical protein